MKTTRKSPSTLAISFSFARRAGCCALALLLLQAPGLDAAGSFRAPISGGDKKPKQDAILKGLPITEISPDEAIGHALNRLAYGPRPGDLERVKQLGLAKWIEQQLNPNSIDDKAMEARLQDYPTLRMSTAKLIDEYPQPKPQEKPRAQVVAQNGTGVEIGGVAVPASTPQAQQAASVNENPNAPAP